MAAVKTVQVVAGGISRWLTPLVLIAIAVGVAYLLRNLLNKYKFRNLGTKAGDADGSNLANDVYNLSGWLTNDDDVNRVCKILNAVSDERLITVYEKFRSLFYDKCPGGGWTCDDTTSMKTYLLDIDCFWSCEEKVKLTDRLSAMGL